MPTSPQDWALSYYKQASAEWRAYHTLSQTRDLPICIPLHVLQMAMEKLGKAHRLRSGDIDVEYAKSHHTAFEKMVAAILSAQGHQIFRDLNQFDRRKTHNQLIELARDIERLCPAVDPTNTPQNSEYPWEHGGHIHVPSEWHFSEITKQLKSPVGLRLFKVVAVALSTFAK
jgi:hypothetical protein